MHVCGENATICGIMQFLPCISPSAYDSAYAFPVRVHLQPNQPNSRIQEHFCRQTNISWWFRLRTSDSDPPTLPDSGRVRCRALVLRSVQIQSNLPGLNSERRETARMQQVTAAPPAPPKSPAPGVRGPDSFDKHISHSFERGCRQSQDPKIPGVSATGCLRQ